MTLEEAFWKKVKKGRGCWIWIGTKNQSGRGQLWYKGKLYGAPRLAWHLLVGSRCNLNVLHTCDNPSCVNPAHLFLGTQKTNMEDMVAKGRRADTHGENHPRHKLTWKQVRQIRRVHKRWCPINGTMALAAKYGVTAGHIQKIVNQKHLNWSEEIKL